MRITNPPATTSAAIAALLTDETGTGSVVLATSPTFVTPLLGTPTSGTLTNCTGLPIATGVANLAAGVATFLTTPSSANLITACTDETGTGALTFATSPTLVTPLLGTPTSGTLTNCTGLPIATGVANLGSGVATFLTTPSSANLLAALTTKTGTGSSVFGTSPTVSNVTYSAGDATHAPIVLTSGTNLTTAAAGSIEFDGTCFYATAAASSRQINDCEQFVTVQGSNFTLANNNSAQSPFAAANDVLQLAASTTYFFECLLYLNTGATTHTTAMEFTASSAFTGIQYWAELWSTTAGTISTTAPSVLDVGVSTATVLNATSTATRTTIRCQGVIRTNASSTVTPKITFSADPTGTCATLVNSYFRIWPVGSNTVAAVGNWS